MHEVSDPIGGVKEMQRTDFWERVTRGYPAVVAVSDLGLGIAGGVGETHGANFETQCALS